MRRIIIVFLLLFPRVLYAQEYTSLDRDFYFDISAIEIGSKEEPELEVLLDIKVANMFEEVCFVLDRADCDALSLFFQDLRNEFNRMERLAKKNKVTNYEYPMSTEAPSLRARWRTFLDDQYGMSRRFTLNIVRGPYLKPVFSVGPTGGCSVDFRFELRDSGRSGASNEFQFHLHDGELSVLARKLRYSRIERVYWKKNPQRPSKEELDELFNRL